MKKRLLSLLLALVMLVGMLPMNIITANAAASPAIPNLHRGVFANKEDTNYVYWDAVDGAEHYEIKLYRNGELRRTETTDECYYGWSEMAPRERDDDISWDYYKVKEGDYVVEVNAIDIYGSLETTLASSQVSFSIAKNEQALAISRSKYNYSNNSVGENVNQYVGWQTVRKSVLDWLGYEFAFVEGPDWLDVVVNEAGSYVLRGTVPASALDSGSTYTYHTAYVGFSKIGKSDVGFVIEHRFQVRGSATINEMWLTPNFEPEYMSIYDIISTNVQPNVTTVYDSTIEGDASSADAWPFGTRRFIGIWKNDEQVKGTVHTFTTGKYELIWQYMVDYHYDTYELVTYADDLKVYWCNELIGTDPNDSCYAKRMSDKQLHIYKTYYIYDEKPEINSVKVNGTSVADGGTVTANNGTVTIKTNYDGLSDAMKDYGCSVKQLAVYYLNGEKITVAAPIPADNGDGTYTKSYTRTLNPGDELRVESWLEVRWPDGSKDRVDERTVTVSGPSRQFITQPHYAGDGMQTGENYVTWKLNFTPIKLIARYNLGTAARPNWKEVELDPTKSRASLPAISQKYTLYAFYGTGARDYVASDAFSAKDPVEFTPAFTLQPANGVSLGGAYAEATWATNFTPVTLALVKINYAPNGRPLYTYEELDVNATYCAVESGFDEYCIYAYYNDTQYVASNKFIVTEIAYYNAWFYVDDTVLDKVMVLEGEYVERPADPVKEGYRFIGWYTDDGEKYNFAATVTDDVHLTAKFEEISTPAVYVGGVGMFSGDYLAAHATATQTTKPSGGYAYYENGVLTLNNYSYEGAGFDDGITISAIIYAPYDIQIKLEGTNTLTQNSYDNSACIWGEEAGVSLTGEGTLNLKNAVWGITSDYDLSVESGNLNVDACQLGIESSNKKVIINGGNLKINATDCAINAYSGIEINGGNVTAIGGDYAILDGFTAAEGMKIQASTTVDGALGEYVAANNDSYKKIVIKPDAGNVLLGDVNLDGAIDAKDLTLLARHVAKIEYITDQQALVNADINKDGGISSEDLTKLARHVAKIEYIVQ